MRLLAGVSAAKGAAGAAKMSRPGEMPKPQQGAQALMRTKIQEGVDAMKSGRESRINAFQNSLSDLSESQQSTVVTMVFLNTGHFEITGGGTQDASSTNPSDNALRTSIQDRDNVGYGRGGW